MKKLANITIILLFVLLFFVGCSSKELPIVNEAIIDKKPMYNLSSLSVETGYEYLSGEQKISQSLSFELQKRAEASIYFTKFKKGILKLKLINVEVAETKERTGSFLYFFSSYKKGYRATLLYSVAAYSASGEELQRVEKKVIVAVWDRNEKSRKELIEKTVDEFQISVFKLSKDSFSKFLAG